MGLTILVILVETLFGLVAVLGHAVGVVLLLGRLREISEVGRVSLLHSLPREGLIDNLKVFGVERHVINFGVVRAGTNSVFVAHDVV